MDELKAQFGEQLNRQGHGFQYSVLNLARTLAGKKASPWVFEASEFPTEVQGSGTRIDFILKLKNTRLFMLAECKRVDPKFSNWCFVKAPFVRRGRMSEVFLAEYIELNPQSICIATAEELDVLIEKQAYHIGFVIKSKVAKGQSGKSGLDAIEQAATQVCRGLNGLVELVSIKKDLITSPTFFVPVIFTTAKLYSCDCNLGSATLENGKLDISKEKLSEVDLIFYQYHISPGIKHSAHMAQTARNFSELLDYEYIRTIPIVSAKGTADFLTSFCCGYTL